jgi:hypothetical protein
MWAKITWEQELEVNSSQKYQEENGKQREERDMQWCKETGCLWESAVAIGRALWARFLGSRAHILFPPVFNQLAGVIFLSSDWNHLDKQ